MNNKGTFYYHADGLGSIMALTDVTQQVVQDYKYDSFGNLKDMKNRVKQPYAFTGREFDRETGLYFYRNRTLDQEVGRFLQKDPIGFEGGINLYAYVDNNPIKWNDPWGLHTVGFNGSAVLVVDDNGNPVAYYPDVTSGHQGHTASEYANVEWLGPIPEGQYSFDPNNFDNPWYLKRIWRNAIYGDWGKVRVVLEPDSATETFDRENFFIHGGELPGSAGCIDLGSSDLDFYNLLKEHEGPVIVIVDYPDYPGGSK